MGCKPSKSRVTRENEPPTSERMPQPREWSRPRRYSEDSDVQSFFSAISDPEFEVQPEGHNDPSDAGPNDELILRLDALQEAMSCGASTAQDVVTACQKALQERPGSSDVLWRSARAKYDESETRPGDKTFQEAKLRDGLALAERAIAASSNNYGGYKWWAIIAGTLGDYLDQKTRIKQAFQIKEYAERALTLNPGDTTTEMCLGKWCMAVAGVSSMERALASAVLATPPKASFEEAEGHFMAALQSDPEPPGVKLLCFLGDCCQRQKKLDAARQWFSQALTATARSKQDEIEQERAKKSLAKIDAKGWFG